jgi:hypothetical protein
MAVKRLGEMLYVKNCIVDDVERFVLHGSY